MNPTGRPKDESPAAQPEQLPARPASVLQDAHREAAHELVALRREVAAARAELAALRADVAAAERDLDGNQASQLLEANEQLVVSAMRLQADAESVAGELDAVSRQVTLDPLTELPNRVLLLDRLSSAVAQAERHGGRVALLFVDLDGFKQINDTLGHAVGDEVLKLVAHRLTACVRGVDTVSRHGGDEFLILLTELSQASDAVLIATKLQAAVAQPGRAGGPGTHLSASVGISLYPDDGLDADLLIQRADAAMYRAKRHAPGSYAFHALPPVHAIGGVARPAVLGHDKDEAAKAHRDELLCAANERLLLSAISAQEARDTAVDTQQRQAQFLAALACKLDSPVAPHPSGCDDPGPCPHG